MPFKGAHSAELVTVLRKQRALVSHLYSFSPAHDVSHPSFQVFTALIQSQPRPLPWLCCGCALSVCSAPGAKSNTLSSPCSWGCHDRLWIFDLPFAYCLQEKCPLHHDTGAQVMLAPQEQYVSNLCGGMPAPHKAGDGQLCKAAHQPLSWLWLNRRQNAVSQ